MYTVSIKQFRVLLIAELGFFILALVSGVTFEKFLPEDLRKYLAYTDPSTHVDMILGVLGMLFIVWYLQNRIALYRLKSYAKKHLLLLTLLSTIFYVYPLLAISPLVLNGVESFFYDWPMFLSGAIISLLYFSNVATYFEKESH